MGLLEESEKIHLLQKTGQIIDRMKKLEEAWQEEHRRLEKAHLQLTTNAETGLPNARVLHGELDALLHATDYPKAAIFLALNDSFGMLKKTFSTKIPEWILYQTALRLQKVIGDKGKIYHTQEDEFLLLLSNAESEAKIIELAKRVVEKVEKSHIMGGYTISLGVNLGIALYPEHGTKKATLLRHADIALAEAVKNKLAFQAFTPELKEQIVERVELQNGILLGLESQAKVNEKPQFELYFQPQVKISNWQGESPQGEVVGAEVLIRWKHPSLGYISPTKFIPIAEETGLIIPLSTWILHSSVNHLLELQNKGMNHLTLSVNLSTRQFNYDDVSTQIKDLVKRRGVSPKNIKLEITESGIMNNYRWAVEKLNSLRNSGFAILVDDFGTGYSSLSHLKKLPVDVLKIDKSFVDTVSHDKSDQALIKAIITIAQEMGLGIIVEGTETKDQIDWLAKHGCNIFQGYYFGKPMNFPDFLNYLKNFPKFFKTKL